MSTQKGWFEEYRCGCVSETVRFQRDLVGYCPKHGESRRHIYPNAAERPSPARGGKGGQVIRRSPLRRVSKKHAKELRTYSKQRKNFLEEHTTCQYPGCFSPAQDLHHVFGRGKFLNVSSTFLALCRLHHNFVHDNPGTARTMNLLK